MAQANDATLGEREFARGPLSSDGACFVLLVAGRIGALEIERLIRKLEIDRQILAEVSAPC
jgi:hypothetical protein